MQLTLIPGLARSGAKRLQIEGVRLASSSGDSRRVIATVMVSLWYLPLLRRGRRSSHLRATTQAWSMHASRSSTAPQRLLIAVLTAPDAERRQQVLVQLDPHDVHRGDLR